MLTKKINIVVIIISQILNFACLVFAAYIAAKFVWWIINPAISEVYVEIPRPSNYEKSTKYIINRYPFGIEQIVKNVESVVEIPKIASQLKVSGVYQSTPDHSLAIINYAGKTDVYGVGSLIADSALVISIESNGVTISEDGKETFIAISQGDSSGASIASTEKPGLQSSPVSQTYDNTQQYVDTQHLSGDEIREKRRKMIEEFTRQQHSEVDNGVNTNNTVNANVKQVNTTDEVVQNADDNNGSNGANN